MKVPDCPPCVGEGDGEADALLRCGDSPDPYPRPGQRAQYLGGEPCTRLHIRTNHIHSRDVGVMEYAERPGLGSDLYGAGEVGLPDHERHVGDGVRRRALYQHVDTDVLVRERTYEI